MMLLLIDLGLVIASKSDLFNRSAIKVMGYYLINTLIFTYLIKHIACKVFSQKVYDDILY
jgi:hypothetical protein